MRFRDDTRGVTVQVGAVLLFATIIIALSVYQATVVPSENADVEYSHSQQVQGQLVDVRNALVATAGTGDARPATVSLGTEYPNRVFLVNPPPAAGTLRTDTYDDPSIEVSNVNATNPETRDFLDGSWTQPTKSLSFVPGYNEYRDAPRLRYEASLLSNYYPEQNTSVPLTDQLLVDNETRTVSLVALNGSLSTSRSSSVAVSPSALSAPAERVQVQPQNPGQPVNVTIPTVVEASVLRNSTSLGDDPDVTVVQDGPQRVTLSIDWSGPFTLRTAKVGVGTDTDPTDVHYLTRVENSSNSVTVEARDRFNNPVSGVKVETADSPPLTESSRITNENGRATFEADDDAEQGTVVLHIGPSDREQVEDTVRGSEAGSGGGGESNDTYDVTWQTPDALEFDEGNEIWVLNTSDGTSVDLTSLVQADDEDVIGATVDYARNESTFDDTSDISLSPEVGVTDVSGRHTTTLSVPEANGSLEVFVASGDDVDSLPIRVEHHPDAASGFHSKIVDQGQTGSLARYETSYDATDVTDFDRVEVTYENLDAEWASQTYTSTEPRDNVDDYGWVDENGGTGGDEYEITVEVFDGDGEVVHSRTVTDVADGENPDGNDDLSEDDSPTLDSTTLRDLDPNNVEYEVDYTVDDSAGKFTETEVLFVNTDSPYATDEVTGTTLSETVEYSGYSSGDDYRILVQVQDDDGVVVDQAVIEDTANGENDAG